MDVFEKSQIQTLPIRVTCSLPLEIQSAYFSGLSAQPVKTICLSCTSWTLRKRLIDVYCIRCGRLSVTAVITIDGSRRIPADTHVKGDTRFLEGCFGETLSFQNAVHLAGAYKCILTTDLYYSECRIGLITGGRFCDSAETIIFESKLYAASEQ